VKDDVELAASAVLATVTVRPASKVTPPRASLWPGHPDLTSNM
jgi:hypothetical protein